MAMEEKVLLVDDEADFTDTLRKVLSRRGYDVETAPDGSQALLDLKMPGLHGLDTLREIKRIDPSIEVVILTGHLLKSSEQEGLGLGAFAYLTKPCAVSEIIAALEAALARRRAAAPG